MTRMKSKVLGALITALAVGAVAIIPAAGSAAVTEPLSESGALAEIGCEANNVCGYTQTGFEGTRYQYPCSGSGNFEAPASLHSARNRCGNKLARLGNGVCLNPGTQATNAGTFGTINLPSQYGTRC